MGKITWKLGTFEYPIPAVMVSCGTMEKSNIITVAWTGIIYHLPSRNGACAFISKLEFLPSYSFYHNRGIFVSHGNCAICNRTVDGAQDCSRFKKTLAGDFVSYCGCNPSVMV